MISVISGASGQDGSYLAELLLEKGEKVIGFSRRTAVHSTKRIDHLLDNKNFTYLEGDVNDQQFIWKIIAENKPDKFFNLAAQSHVHTSFSNPESTFNIDTLGVLCILEAIKTLSPETRFYQASTSEMFGSNVNKEYEFATEDYVECVTFEGNIDKWRVKKYFQNESTPFAPNSPYAIAKLAAHHLVRLYRESYGLKCCSGILFNHESPRRGENFVTQKIIKWLVAFKKWKNREFYTVGKIWIPEGMIYYGQPKSEDIPEYFPKLRLGNLDASRDWGHARDYVEAMDMMISTNKLDDYVVGTGETHTIREFLDEAFHLAGIKDWSNYVIMDPKFIRPCEVPYLCAGSDKIKRELDWTPKTSFKELVKDMYEAELQRSGV